MSRTNRLKSFRVVIAANVIGNGWAPALNFICVPFYLHYIGAEGYGLIGIFASLQVLLSFLDSGLSITLTKELAALSAMPDTQSRMRNLVKTLGTIYWMVAASAGILALSLSHFLANSWVHPNTLSKDAVQTAFMLLSISVVFQFPCGFYSGGLVGLQKQITFNILRVTFATLRTVGALAVLIFYSPTVIAFFSWILIVSVLQAISFRLAVWKSLPASGTKAKFDKTELKRIWRFATGITSITVIASLLMQIDKIMLSKSFTLQQIGYYTLSQTIAGMFVSLVVPAFTQSLFPKFNTLLVERNTAELNNIYLLNCKRISYVVFPISIFICLFSYQLLLLYTHNEVLAKQSHLVLSFFIIGFLINSTLHLPYNLALAIGFTRKIIKLYGVLLLIYIPLLYISLLSGKIVNASIAYVILQLAYLILLIPLIQNRTKLVSVKKWYLEIIIKPLLTSLLLIAPFYLILFYSGWVNNNLFFILFSCVFMGIVYLVIEKLYNLFNVFKRPANA